MPDMISQVKEFARQSHGDQQRKFADEPFINHPIRVMETCKEYTDREAILIAALLHDVLEDTEVSRERLKEFLLPVAGDRIATDAIKLVEELTDIYTKKAYPQWNRRKRKSMESARLKQTSPDSQTIKYADMIDNSLELSGAEPDFKKLFLHECRALLKVMTAGDQRLYKRAVETINSCIEKL
jgi:(p)ppGpp synthase/HD superfamily hydrolase